jgi:hypothetical protein
MAETHFHFQTGLKTDICPINWSGWPKRWMENRAFLLSVLGSSGSEHGGGGRGVYLVAPDYQGKESDWE